MINTINMSIILPSNLGSETVGRPFLHFHPKRGNHEDIFLPVPPAIEFSDGGSYSTIDMGFAGQDSTKKNVLKASAMDILKGAAEGLTPMVDAEKLMASDRMLFNPNTNTTFQGNTVRSFSFPFTLVGRTPSDAQEIRKLHNTLRSALYPDCSSSMANIIIEYPTTWDIKFRDSAGAGSENSWFPKIYESYLASLSTNFNPSALMFRTDMSPVEVNLTITFQETRSLTKQDIESLSAG